MARIDIVDTASEGYMLAWRERGYLFRLAAAPMLIKMLCYMAMLVLGIEGDFIRQALVMLPSYFADGWLCSHLTRLVFFGQRWPFRRTGDAAEDMRVLQRRALGIMRGTLTFTLIQYLMAGITAFLVWGGQTGAEAGERELTMATFIAALGAAVVFVWAFRLVWLYIPAAVNYPLRKFLDNLGGFSTSWALIGIWLICFVPLYFVFNMTYPLLGFPGEARTASAGILVFATLLHTLADTMTIILATAALAFAARNYYIADGTVR